MLFRSFRFKIQFILITVIISILSLFVYYTSDIFFLDKKTDVYENLLVTADMQGHSLKQYFSDRFNISRMLFMNVSLAKTLSWERPILLPNRFFTDFNDFRKLRIFRTHGGQTVHMQSIVNPRVKTVERIPDDYSEEEHVAQENFNKYINEGFGYQHLTINGNWVLKVHFYDPKTFIFGSFEFDISLGANVFTKRSELASLILGTGGRPLLTNDESVGSLQELFDINSILKLRWGVHKIKGLNDKDYIVSFAPVPEYGFYALNYIPEERAFLNTFILLGRSFRFGIAIAFVVALLSVLMTKHIVGPMVRLTASAKKIASGVYEPVGGDNRKDEIGVLCKSFNEMIATVQSYMKELESQNVILEEKVQQRTRALNELNQFMSAMVNSLNEGLFVINQNGTVLPLYTDACGRIFGQELKGRTFDVLIGKDESRSLRDWLDTVYSGIMPFEQLTELAPGPVINIENRFVQLSYYPIMNDDKLENIVVVASDVTKQVSSERKLKEKQEETKALLKVLGNKGQFLSFVYEVQDKIKKFSINNSFTDGHASSEFILFLHSFKGSVAQFGGASVAEMVHEVENLVEKEALPEIVWPKYAESVYLFKQFLDRFTTFFGKSIVDGKARVEVEKSLLREAYDSLLPINSFVASKLHSEVFLEPIHEYFSAYCSETRTIASSLGKSIAPLEFVNSDIKVDASRFSALFSSMVHLFRNIADHGVEFPDERVEQGKNEQGKVTVHFSSDTAVLRIKVSDDGQGVNIDAVKEKLVSNGVDISNYSDEMVLNTIFEDHLSTKDKVSELSGRGVGLGAIRYEVEKLGGRYTVNSVRHQGTEFMFEVPNA